MNEIIRYEDVESKILSIRNQQVIIDRDVAELYGVETKDINRAVKNNPNKFPSGYIIMLEDIEKIELVKNFNRFEKLKHSTVTPTAFTDYAEENPKPKTKFSYLFSKNNLTKASA